MLTDCSLIGIDCTYDADGWCSEHEQWECGCRPGHDCPAHDWDFAVERREWEDD